MNAIGNSSHPTCSRCLKTQSVSPFLVSMIPRPAGDACGGCPAASGESTGGVGRNCSALNLCISRSIVVLFLSQPSDFVDLCLHHICLSLSLSVSLSPQLSCHAHDSRCATEQLCKQVKWRFPKSVACVVSTTQCRVHVRRTWMTRG